MKKQLRLVLFAALVLVMLMTMVFLASASDVPAPTDADNYQVVDATGAHVGYYATLTEALAGVTADNYKIVVLKDVTEATIVKLNKAFAYTITGGTEGKTITFAKYASYTFVGMTRGNLYIAVESGAVTFDNLTLKTAATSAAKHYIATKNAGVSLTLHNTKVEGETTHGLVYAYKQAAITVSGNSELGAGSKYAFEFSASGAVDCTLDLRGGTISADTNVVYMTKGNLDVTVGAATVNGGSAGVFYFTLGKSGTTSSITLNEGADIRATAGAVFDIRSATNITMNEGASVTAQGADVFATANANPAAFTWNGGDIHLNGAAAKLAGDVAKLTGTVTSTKGAVYLENGASTPDESLDSVFDWTNIGMIIAGFEGAYEITAGGVYDMSSIEKNHAIAKAAIEAMLNIDKVRFPLGQVDISGWIPIVVNHAEAVVTVGCDYNFTGNNYLVKVIAGTVTVVGGTYRSENALLLMEGGTLNIMGGSYTMQTVVDVNGGVVNVLDGTYAITTFATLDGAATLNIANGTFTRFSESGTATYFVVNHADAALNISGGTYKGANVAVRVQAGAFTMSGGYILVPVDQRGIIIDGAATVVVQENAAGAAYNPVIEVEDISSSGAVIFELTANAANVDKKVALTVSAGSFGNLKFATTDSYCYVLVQKGTATVDITGGLFVGCRSVSVVDIYSGTLNVSGGEFRGYRNIRTYGTVTVNISGGSFNRFFDEASGYVQTNNILIDLSSVGATLNISGGNFNNFSRAIFVNKKGTITITGGTFTQGAQGKGDSYNLFVHLNDTVELNIGKIEEDVAYGPTINLKQYGRFMRIESGKLAVVTINGGTFNATHKDNVLFELVNATSVNTLAINGGDFHVIGEGAGLLPAVLDKSGVTVTGGHVTLEAYTLLPMYLNIDTSKLSLTINGPVQNFVIARPNMVQRVDPEDNPVLDEFEQPIYDNLPYIITSLADQRALLETFFTSITIAEGVELPWLQMTLNHADAILHLENLSLALSEGYGVRVVAGTVLLKGGNYSITVDGKLIDMQGTATVTLQDGIYYLAGAGADLIAVAGGVDTTNVAIDGITLTVGALGKLPIDTGYAVSLKKLTVYGLSEMTFDQAGTYDVSADTIQSYIEGLIGAIAAIAEEYELGVTSWVPIHVNHPDAIVNITGGNFTSEGSFLFKVTQGTLNITGGTFNALGGDLIHLLGAGKVYFAPAEGSEITVNVLGAVIYAYGAANSEVVISGGRFVELTPDISGNQKDALFVYDTSSRTELDLSTGATLTIEDGYFEATRLLLLYYSESAAIINDGTFVSNFVVKPQGPVTVRSSANNNEHFMSPRGPSTTLTINGGSFDNKQGRYMIAANGGEAGAVTTINGGTFNGGSAWYMTNGATTLNITGGTFTDTDGYVLESGFFYLNHVDAVMTVSGGEFTASIPSKYIFYTAKGQLTVSDCDLTGSAFYVTTDSRVSVSGGTYLVTGDKATLLYLGNGTNTTHFKLTDTVNFVVEDYAFILKTYAVDNMVTKILENARITVKGNARFDAYQALERININSMTDVKNLMKRYIPYITFMDLPLMLDGEPVLDLDNNPIYIPSTYGLSFYGATDARIHGGDWNFAADALFYVYGGADLTITGGTFNVTGGDMIYVSSANGSSITFGKEGDACTPDEHGVCDCLKVTVGKGGNVLHVAGVATTTVIYSGHFVKEKVDRENYHGPLFYYASVGSDTKKASTLTIYGGYFEAARILMDYYGKVTTTIYGGTFLSNMVEEKMTEAEFTNAYYAAKDAASEENPFVFDPINHAVRDNAYLMNVRGYDSKLIIYGGHFDGKYGHSIFTSNGGDGAVFEFYGGYFTGSYYWFWSNRVIELIFGSHETLVQEINPDTGLPVFNPDGTPKMVKATVSPTFEGLDSFTDHGFNLSRSGDVDKENPGAGPTQVIVRAGTFTMKDLYGRNMWNFQGPTDMKIYGGEFSITMDPEIANANRVPYGVIFRTDNSGSMLGTTDMDIHGGTFIAARIIFYRYAGGTLNIYGGEFISNLIATQVPGDAKMINIAYDDAIFNIYGGTFVGNEYTYSILCMNTATGGKMQMNILGGYFMGGGKWLYVNQPGAIKIGKNPLIGNPEFAGYDLQDPTFRDLSVKTSDTVYGFYIHNNFTGGTLDISYLDMVLDASNAATAAMVLEGGTITFSPADAGDIRVDVYCRMFQVTNAFRGQILIKDGLYTSRDVANMFYYVTTHSGAISGGLEIYHSNIIIEGGNFEALDRSTMFNIMCEVEEYSFIIKGGNFRSEGARIFYFTVHGSGTRGTRTNVVIEDGVFTSTAPNMFDLDQNSKPMVIKGGIFTFEDRNGRTTDDAIIYSAGKGVSSLLVSGGEFFDYRTGSNQSFMKMNANADFRFEGDFKLYTQEKKPYFLRDTVTPSNSVPMDKSSLGDYNGEPFYICFGFYDPSGCAPVMVGTPVIRPVLGAEGITFTASMTAEAIAALKEYGTVSYGTLIFKTDSLGTWQNGIDFKEELDNVGAKYVMVEAKNGLITNADGSIVFRASITNIKAANHTKSYTGIAYAKVTDADGTETYYWATHTSAAVSTTMRSVAEYAINDVNDVPIVKNGRNYCYVSIMKNNSYSRYASVLQDSLRQYLDPSKKPIS